MSEWKPIETAPTDGTKVLIFWAYWSAVPFVAYFRHGQWIGDEACSDGVDDPTHWMPLPDPPSVEKVSA